MAIPPVATTLALELASSPKVHQMAVKMFDSVYSRIFKETKIETIEVAGTKTGPTDRQLLEQLVASQPSNEEMGIAFASLQAELRRGQQRLWFGLAGFGVVNVILLLILIFK